MANEEGATGMPMDNEASPSSWSLASALSAIPPHKLLSLQPSPTTPVPFFHILERLKTIPRAGWTRFSDVPRPESISDHMYRMSLVCLLAPSSVKSQINTSHCMQLALVHDMAESIVGDITPKDKVSKAEKERRERETMEFFETKVLGGYDGGAQGKMLRDLWEEYEAGVTKEAKFVKDVDKLELLLQMVEYEKSGNGRLDLGEFGWVKKHIAGEVCKEWAAEVIEERRLFWEGLGRTPTGPLKPGDEKDGGVMLTEKQDWEAHGEVNGSMQIGSAANGSVKTESELPS